MEMLWLCFLLASKFFRKGYGIMNYLWRKSFLVMVAAGGMLAFGMQQMASAGAISYSFLNIDNLRVFDNSTGVQLNFLTDFVPSPAFIDSASASATSSFGPPVATSNPIASDTPLACSGNCAGIAQNNTAQQVGTNNFGRGDTGGNGGAIVTNAPGGLPSFSQVFTVAEGRQGITGTTQGAANVSNTTNFTFALAGTGTIDVRADFTATAQLFVQLDQPETRVIASDNWSITLVDNATGNVIVDWDPDGSLLGGITGGTEFSDPFSLNTQRQLLGTSGTVDTGVQTGFFSASFTLNRGQLFDLSVSHSSDAFTLANVNAIPEPGTLTLLGIGLLVGYGVLRRNQRTKV